MSVQDAAIYLGRSDLGEHVYAQMEIRPGNPERTVTFTDHSVGREPDELAITFAVLGRGTKGIDRPLRDVPEGWWRAVGQVQPEHRRIVRRAVPPEVIAVIEDAWERYHLNRMCAACDHMTPDMLAKREGESTLDWQSRMLDTVTCPETGYRWGSAWLAKRVPDDVLVKLRGIWAMYAK